MKSEKLETFCPIGRKQWRQWLQKNHNKKQSIWLICYKGNSGKPTISWSDAVDEALCFGWIDSVRKPIDHEKFTQYFSRRKTTSTWSKINKAKVLRLIDEGLMTEAGLASIDAAKQNGSWTILDKVEKLTIPKDLKEQFKTRPGSGEFFLGLSKSVRKMMLQWVTFAKRPETREKRIAEIVEMAAVKRKPKQF